MRLVATWATALLAVLPGDARQMPVDEQYNRLFEDHNATVMATAQQCVSLSPAAGMPDGSFVMPSLGQFGMAGTTLNGALDAYGKLSRFTIVRGQVCFATRMMHTGWWNASVKAGTVGPALLFYETTPPRGNSAMKNLNGPNDNSYVNTLSLGDRYFGVTDSRFVVEFDPESLAVLSDVKFEDHLDKLTVALGSAHPLPDPANGGNGANTSAAHHCILGVRPQEVAMLVHEVMVYRVCADAPTRRVRVNALHTGRQLAYFHSFGVSPRFAILPLQHITFDMLAAMTKGDVAHAFKPFDMGQDTRIDLLPLDGTAANWTFQVPGDVYFVHAINAFENATSVVFDATAYHTNFFDDTSLTDWRNATRRNMNKARGAATRFAMHTSGPRKGLVDVTPLSHVGRSTDFPKINPTYHARPYCLYWAIEWWHDDAHMSSMAIVRQDVCTGQRSYWHREAAFPSEPTFVPRAHAATEDDGVLVFTLLDGATGTTSLMMVDARTMQAVGEAVAPKEAAIGYTTHGQWYDGLAPRPRL